MQALDSSLFLMMTAGPDAPAWAVAVAWVLATGLVPMVALALLVAWIVGRDRPLLLDAVASGLIGLGLVQVIGALSYRPRPFETGLGLNLMQHVPENSFPSDHATLVFAIATTLLMSPWRKIGLMLLILGLGVGWGRVYLGAHYPFDILAGAALGALCAVAVRQVTVRLALWSWIERVYAAILARVA